jgi:hypothetical protein
MNGVAMPRSNTKRRSSKPATTVITHVAAHDLRVNGSTQVRMPSHEMTSARRNGAATASTPYQREFVYKGKQRDAVIDTIFKSYPLNVMYWAVRTDGSFEIIDGQQRTISVCQYVNGDFSFEGRYFHNLQADEKEKLLNYELTVYCCSGTDSEKLAWLKTINIAGEKLTDQE